MNPRVCPGIVPDNILANNFGIAIGRLGRLSGRLLGYRKLVWLTINRTGGGEY